MTGRDILSGKVKIPAVKNHDKQFIIKLCSTKIVRKVNTKKLIIQCVQASRDYYLIGRGVHYVHVCFV